MEQDRRRFLTSALAAAPLFVPRSAWGANDRLSYGLIGAGGRGRYLCSNFQKLGAECVAVAEVYEPNLEPALKDAPDAKSLRRLSRPAGAARHRRRGDRHTRPSALPACCWPRSMPRRTSTWKSPCRIRSKRASA